MKLPNGYGSVVKMSGKRRKPYAVRITDGTKLNKDGRRIQKYRFLEYFENVLMHLPTLPIITVIQQ